MYGSFGRMVKKKFLFYSRRKMFKVILFVKIRDQLHDVANKHWSTWNDEGRQRMSRMAAAAAWGLGKWESMEQYVSCIPQDTQDGAFYRAVLAVHREQYTVAQQFIDLARDLVWKFFTFQTHYKEFY